MDIDDLLAKYEQVSPDEAEGGWRGLHTLAADESTSKMAPRRGEVCMLSGTLTPLWSTLSGLVREHSAELTRLERQLKVVRVQTTDSHERIVGVRWSAALRRPLRERLDLLRASKAGFSPSAGAGAVGSTAEEGDQVDAKALERALKAKPTIMSFFSAVPKAAVPKAAAEPRKGGLAGAGAGNARWDSAPRDAHGEHEVVDLTSEPSVRHPPPRAQGSKRPAAALAGGSDGKKGKGKGGSQAGISSFFKKG
mmetsp:Transcript_13676/g.34840  ORF Transcript_13676/g.34840 Transcript_13676/m.34840 type:complete len:251 (+) Transcript_13676:442-1194(+)